MATFGAVGVAPRAGARAAVRSRSLGVEKLGRRARFERGAGVVGAARRVVSESRERTFGLRRSRPRPAARSLQTMADELCASLRRARAQRAHDRRRGLAGRFPRPPRARARIEAPTSDVERVTAVALRLRPECAPVAPGAPARRGASRRTVLGCLCRGGRTRRSRRASCSWLAQAASWVAHRRWRQLTRPRIDRLCRSPALGRSSSAMTPPRVGAARADDHGDERHVRPLERTDFLADTAPRLRDDRLRPPRRRTTAVRCRDR